MLPANVRLCGIHIGQLAQVVRKANPGAFPSDLHDTPYRETEEDKDTAPGDSAGMMTAALTNHSASCDLWNIGASLRRHRVLRNRK